MAISTSHNFASIVFAEALNTIMACGKTGWFDDFSNAAAAQLTSFSNTLSMTLEMIRLKRVGLRDDEFSPRFLEDEDNDVGKSVQKTRI